MRRALLIAALLVLACGVWLWGAGGMRDLAAWAAAGQQEAQRAMAAALRALRAGDPGALAALWGLCFTYGFFHAVGPGHGKILVGGYGLGAEIPLARLSGLALAASLAQGASAVALVGAGMVLLGWGRQDMVVAAESWFAPASYAAIAGVGLWLCARGLRGLLPYGSGSPALTPALAGIGGQDAPALHGERPEDTPDGTSGQSLDAGAPGASSARFVSFATPQADRPSLTRTMRDAVRATGRTTGPLSGEICPTCGHAHGPSLDEARALTSWRDALALVGAIAIRPCTGAIFILILTFGWGLVWQGISAVLAMALGVAAVTIAVGVAAVTLREGALRQTLARLSQARAARARGLVEMSVGAGIALIASGLLIQAL